MVNWSKVTIEKVTSMLGDGLHGTPKYSDDGEYAFVNGNNLVNGKIVIKKDTKRVDETQYIKYKKPLSERTLMVSINGTLGNVGEYNGEKIILGKSACYFNVIESVNKNYIKYVVSSPYFKEYLERNATGTTIKNISLKQMREYEFLLPERRIQDRISEILGAIDKRIEVNEKINDNLEQQLDAIYHEMYPYLPSDKLPDGWNCISLGNLCDSISIKHAFNQDELIFLNTGDVENGQFLHSTYSPVKDMPGQAKKSIQTGDILYSEIRPINRHFAFVTFPANDYVVSTKLMVIRSYGIDSRRLYHYLTTQEVIDELQMEAESRSGTFPQIRFENIQRIPIIIAPSEEELKFTHILHECYKLIDHNIVEIQKLTILRDTILPKLMSGDLDISNVDI